LRAIERARQRISALIVDPVVDAHAVLDRIAERRLRRARGLLARLQRQSLLRAVLVHAKRRRLLIARDKPSADERVTDGVQVRCVNGKSEALRQPRNQPLFLRRPDFDGPVDVGRVQRVRQRRLARESRRRSIALEHGIARIPSGRNADDQHGNRRGCIRQPRRHASPWRARPRRVDELLRQLLVQDRIEAAAQPRILALDLGDARGECGIACERLLECQPALGRQLAVGVGVKVVGDVGVRTHARGFIARS